MDKRRENENSIIKNKKANKNKHNSQTAENSGAHDDYIE